VFHNWQCIPTTTPSQAQNSHFYWNLASVRAIIPGQIKDEELFTPLDTILSRYPAQSYELIIGSATATDFDHKTVEIEVHTPGGNGSDNDTTRTLAYDQLVLATGARTASPDTPWKASGSYDDALTSLHATAAAVHQAKHIVVAGGGSTGIEVAGELAYEYGKTKEIVLLCAGEKLAGGHSIAGAAAAELAKLHVTVRYGARVQETRPTGRDQTDVVLANGDALTTDLFLPTTGLVPNSEYVPAQHLSADPGYRCVLVDDCLRVMEADCVWACGDVVSKPRAGLFITQKQADGVARNVALALEGKDPAAVKGPPVDIFACAVGRGRGVGRVNNSIRLPSIMIWAVKGRMLGLNMVKGYVDGSVAK
jgi:NADH dehydrogenase FAD-containing subunit